MKSIFFLGVFVFGIFSSSGVAKAESLAGYTYNKVTGTDFSFDPPYGNFAGITYNPLTQTWFVTDNVLDKLFAIQANGNLLRTIDLSGLKRSGIATSDAEGVAWMYGQTFAFALHDGKEIAVIQILPTTTSLLRTSATIYDIASGPGKPKGLTYVGFENSFYWVTKDAPKTVVKSKINASTGRMDTLWSKPVDNLPVTDLADVAVFPRLSPHLLLISESSKAVLEVNLTGATAVLKSNFSIATSSIPQAGGLVFGPDAKMYIVGKHVSGAPEDDFNVFAPTSTINNRNPIASVALVIR